MMHNQDLANSLENSNQQVNQRSQAKRIDMKCKSTCMRKGFLPDFCEEKCSY